LAEGFDLSHFGAAPTKFDEADLWPLTANVLQEMDVSDMAAELAALGVPDDLARDVWEVARANITKRAEVAEWWTLFRDGATPLVEDEDRDFVAEAFALLPEPPYGPETWATGRRGEGGHGPQGQGAVHAAEEGRHGAGAGAGDGRRDAALQKKPTL
jgi:glutamyl-tRNA synthetase